MNIATWLTDTMQVLTNAGIGTARLDCMVLLEDITGKDRSWLLAHPEFELDDESFRGLQTLTERREKHEPLAYIRGKTEFYGREFTVNCDVLEPRPESETMIDLLVSEQGVRNTEYRIIDVGTGSGALAVTAKLELPNATVTAIDIDKKCLNVAKRNADRLGADVQFFKGDLLRPVLDQDSDFCIPNSIILANLPYVPNSYQINEAAMQEPRLAIFGGEDGLDLYRRLFDQIQQYGQASNAPVLTESLPFQHKALAKIAEAHNFKQVEENDFIQVFTRG